MNSTSTATISTVTPTVTPTTISTTISTLQPVMSSRPGAWRAAPGSIGLCRNVGVLGSLVGLPVPVSLTSAFAVPASGAHLATAGAYLAAAGSVVVAAAPAGAGTEADRTGAMKRNDKRSLRRSGPPPG